MSFLNPTQPANWALLDEAAFSGRYVLVSNEEFFALAKWSNEDWVHSSGRSVGYEPTYYLKRERPDG